MINFDFVTPRHLDEVPDLLADGGGVILAGGTDLLDRLKERLDQPERVVNIKAIPDLRGIANGRSLKIGALTTIADLAADSRLTRDGYRVLAEAAGSIAPSCATWVPSVATCVNDPAVGITAATITTA